MICAASKRGAIRMIAKRKVNYSGGTGSDIAGDNPSPSRLPKTIRHEPQHTISRRLTPVEHRGAASARSEEVRSLDRLS